MTDGRAEVLGGIMEDRKTVQIDMIMNVRSQKGKEAETRQGERQPQEKVIRVESDTGFTYTCLSSPLPVPEPIS